MDTHVFFNAVEDTQTSTKIYHLFQNCQNRAWKTFKNAKVSNSCFSNFSAETASHARDSKYVSTTNKPQYSQELPLYWLKWLGWYCCIYNTFRAHTTTHRKENLACFKMLLSYQNTEAYGIMHLKMHNLYLSAFVSQYVQHPSQSVQLVLKSFYRGLHFIWNYKSPKCTNVGSSSVRLPMHWFFDCPWHIVQEDSIFVLISWFLWVPFSCM